MAADEKASELQIQVIRDGSATVPKEFRVVSDSLTAVLEVTTGRPAEKLPMWLPIIPPARLVSIGRCSSHVSCLDGHGCAASSEPSAGAGG